MDHFIKEHSLECFFCFLKFASFEQLAEHVQAAHVSPENRGRERAPTWDEPWEGVDMALPRPGGGKSDSQRGGGRGNRQAPAVPFLKVEDLTQDPKRAKILGVQTQNTGFNDVIVKIAIGGRSFFMGLKASNPNYEALFNAFGEDDNKWVGQEFMVGLNYNEFYEKNFVHIFEAPAPERGKKSKD
jgi:hypothetical protein